jgi:hypothetical protein
MWHEKIKYFRKLAKGWSANLEDEIRKHKKQLMEEYYSMLEYLTHQKWENI